ncbi:MAG: hypothetical protein Q9M09_05390 [Mariprofundaceae bacterium]|nr:hypothetical protein [Mariprofundaceae bacterium]
MTKHSLKVLLLTSLYCLTLGILSACGGGGAGGVAGQTQVTIGLGQTVAAGALAAPGTIPARVQSFRVTAFNAAGQAIAGPVTATLPQNTVALSVPNGTGITFQLLAYDAGAGLGKVIYRGVSAAQNLNGQAVNIPIQINLEVTATASALQVLQGGSVNLTGFIAGLTPPTTSPLLWTATGGTMGSIGVNGATAIWTAGSANTVVGQSYTMTARIDPALNPQQSSTVVGQVTVLVVTQVNIMGFSMAGNIFSVNNVTSTVDSYGNATAATGFAAQPLSISFQFRDYYTAAGNTAATYNPAFKFDIREAQLGTRLAVGTITPVTISSTGGQVSVSVPATAVLNYTGRTAAGTQVNGVATNITPNIITTSATTGVVTLDINALLQTIAGKSLASMNVFATPGVFNYEIGFDTIHLGHESLAGNSMDRLNDTGLNTGTRGLRGSLTIQ